MENPSFFPQVETTCLLGKRDTCKCLTHRQIQEGRGILHMSCTEDAQKKKVLRPRMRVCMRPCKEDPGFYKHAFWGLADSINS